ncbi:MAG TPA: lamin tail domain-containing protein [bacterium]|nr:lamin tail domain-containing protein [bacterium]HPQ66935.1 lamin tail domain-containing protein [bacterium]
MNIRKSMILTAALSLAFLSVLPGLMAQITIRPMFCPVRLNEIGPNPGSGNDDGREFIELWNRSDDWVDISSWRVADSSSSDTLADYTGAYDVGLPGLEIPPWGFAVIVESDYSGYYNDYLEEYAGVNNFILVRVDDSQIGSILNDTGDTVTVTTHYPSPLTSGYQKLTHTYGAATEGVSIERDRYDQNSWIDSPDPEFGCTPGGINSYQ